MIKLVAGDNIPEERKNEINAKLEEVNKVLNEKLIHSNFYSALENASLDFSVTGAAVLPPIIFEDD